MEKYGYPFKSKQHSHNLSVFKNSGFTKSVNVYLGREKTSTGKDGLLRCPQILEYQFSNDFKLNCSDKCCLKLKKELSHKWQVENNKKITITGMRKEEGGSRTTLSCLTNNNTKFHPLSVVDEDWENEFVKRENVKLSKLYYPPYNFKRTGCKGCPFALNLQNELLILKKLLPNEYKQCLSLWKPVYDEYVRLGYRLDKNFYDIAPQYTIDDFL